MPASDPGLVSGWVVQVKSTTDKEAADALQVALAREGFPAFVISAEVRNQTWHRVRVGRYRERSDAETVAGQLGERGDVESTWVTEG
jgi:cell division protein FtsN